MSEWIEQNLEEIALINPTEKLLKGQINKKIGMEHLMPFMKKPQGITREPYNGGMKFRNGDTLIARITPCLENGKTAYVDVLDENEIGFGSTEYIVLRQKRDKSDKQFLYYFAKSENFRDIAIASMTGSSGRQRVQLDALKKHKFLIPPLPEQQAIAGVLSALDDKIDLLQRQNQTLEQMAATLFRQWFIEEAKEDWEQVTLADICLKITDGAHHSPETMESGYAMASVKDMHNWGINRETCRKISESDYISLVDADCKAVKGVILPKNN